MREITKATILAAVVLAIAPVGHADTVNADGDWQLWTHERASIKIAEKTAISVGAMYRFGDDMSDLWYQHYDAGIVFKASKWLSIMPQYRLKMVNLDKFSGSKWLDINNTSLNFIFSKKVGKVALKNNCRFSYWDYEKDFNRKDLLYYRNILMMVGPALTKTKIKPYIQEDFFFNTDIDKVDRNRLSAGFLACKWKKVTPRFYMMWQAFNKNGLWENSNADNYIVGLDFKIKW